jgi:hypothetical protein
MTNRAHASAALSAFAALAAAVPLGACQHPSPFAVDDDANPGVEASAALHLAPADAAPTAAPHEDLVPPAMYVGARRARLTALDNEPALAKNADAIRAHFDGGLPAAMDLQAIPLGGSKQALLLSASATEANPIALLAGADGSALWIKQHPLGGITPPARPFAMAPRPDNGIVLFVYDEPTKLVAARMWDEDGNAYAELIVFELPRCDALSAAWWPGHGWIVVASFPGGARAQLLGEESRSEWDPKGISVGEAWRGAAPATLVIDPATSTWILVQHATRGGVDHVVALRYGADGARIGNRATDLGAVKVVRTLDRVNASLARPGVAAVEVGGVGGAGNTWVEMNVEAPR